MSRSRVLFVDGSQGASGDMILGALVDLGVPLDTLRNAVERLPIDGWSLASRRISRCALDLVQVEVGVHGEQPARGWADLRRIIEGGTLADDVARRALAVFRGLIEAEARVHGRDPDEVHLHEAGGTDAIVDVVGACAGLEHLAVGRVVVSELTTGYGEVRCAHGVYPVPAPATALLLRGVPVRGGTIEAERLTPTGAAILTQWADAWSPLPAMRPRAVGYGAGARDLGTTPNALRMILGDAARPEAPGSESEIAVLEADLDDATPQALAHAAERLLAGGALDVTTSAVTMKKGRAGHRLTVLARVERTADLARTMLAETGSLGLRYRTERRFELERQVVRVATRFGPIDVKLGLMDGRIVRAWPEFDQCRERAVEHEVALVEVQRAALEAHADTSNEPE